MLRPLPRPGKPLQERRVRRSQSVVDALEMALTCAASRGGCDAVLVADDKGMLVSNSNTPLDLEMLAAVTPIVARGEARASIKRGGRARELAVDSIEVLGEVLHVAVLGGADDSRITELSRTLAAARRILAA
jgi:ketopantoate hydroxymethyltransferase